METGDWCVTTTMTISFNYQQYIPNRWTTTDAILLPAVRSWLYQTVASLASGQGQVRHHEDNDNNSKGSNSSPGSCVQAVQTSSLIIKQDKGYRTIRVKISRCKIMGCYCYVQKYLGDHLAVDKSRACPITGTYAIAGSFDSALSQVDETPVQEKKIHNQIQMISVTPQGFLPEFPASKKKKGIFFFFAIHFFCTNHISLICDPSQSKHFFLENLKPYN